MMLSALLASVPLVISTQVELTRAVVGPAGGFSNSATYETQATIGEPVVGIAESASFSVSAGFWGRGAIVCCVADLNCDGQLTSDDFFDFLACFFSGSCDINDDGFTDSRDFFRFLDFYLFDGC